MQDDYPEDPESLWLVSRTISKIESHYFDNEDEARQFASANPGFVVEAPVKQ